MPAKFSDRETQERRLEIIHAVAPVFADKGYDGATVRDLEAATGLSRGGIFFHFPGKRELYLETLECCAMEGPSHLADGVLAAETAEESLLAAFHAILHWHGEHPEAMQFFQQIHATSAAEDLTELDKRISRSMDDFVEGVVRQLQAKCVMDPDLDPAPTAALIHGVMDHLVEAAVDMPRGKAEAMARKTFHVMARGLDPRG